MHKKKVVLLCTSFVFTNAFAADLPTLFYSAAERQAIQQMRSGESGAIKPETIVRYSGVVQRSSGKNTVWMNAQAHKESEAYQPSYDRTLKLQGKQLQVGDQLDTSSGEVKELLPAEAIKKSTKK
jgi:hypothetical protein